MNILDYFIQEREAQVDPVFLEFELEKTTDEDKALIKKALAKDLVFKTNPHNSILLYVLGLTNEFDLKKGRSHHVGGSPPD